MPVQNDDRMTLKHFYKLTTSYMKEIIAENKWYTLIIHEGDMY